MRDEILLTIKEYISAKGEKCPVCESKNIDRLEGHPIFLYTKVAMRLFCMDCDAQWDDIYHLAKYSIVEVEDRD